MLILIHEGPRFLISNSTSYSQQKGLRRAKTYAAIMNILPFVLRGPLESDFGSNLFPSVLNVACINVVRAQLLEISPSLGISESNLNLLAELDTKLVTALSIVSSNFLEISIT